MSGQAPPYLIGRKLSGGFVVILCGVSMTGSLTDLLRRFERELIDQERGRRDFAERFPAEAGALGIEGGAGHPHTQGLLDAISFTNARTADRLERNQQQMAHDLIAALLPHMDRPSPSATTACFDFGDMRKMASQQAAVIPRGTVLFSHQHEGVRCEFRTAYDVSIVPVRIAAASFITMLQPPSTCRTTESGMAGITITIETVSDTLTLMASGVARLRLFIDADAAFAANLRDTLFMRTVGAWLQAGEAGHWKSLEKVPLLPVGFAADEAMLPWEARAHPAYRVLSEYFLYPEKFNFFDIDLETLIPYLPPECRSMTLHLGVRLEQPNLANVLASLTSRHLQVGCTPIVNLFHTAACPVYRDYTKSEYALLPSVRNAQAYEIYSVDSVCATKKNRTDAGITQFYPYYSLKHGLADKRRGHYWFLRRDAALAEFSPGNEMAISLIDSGFNPLIDDAGTVSIGLTCTNRDLPSRLPFGVAEGDLSMANPLGGFPIRMLRQPGRSYRFSDGDRWRLVSHLSVSQQTLLQEDLAPLTETLALYDWPQTAVTRRQIAGLRGISHRPARVYWQDGFASGYLWGVEVTLRVDEEAYAGGGLHLFAQVLDHLFGLAVHLNSFVQLIVTSHLTGKELLRCKPRKGMLALV
jgi:type VI secretion system protein ImpG